MGKTDQLVLTVGDKGRVTLPEEVRKHLGIRAGDVIVVDLSEKDTAQMVPVALIPRDQVWFNHPDAQARMTEAHDDIAAGRTTNVRTTKEMARALAALKRSARSD